MKVKVITRYVDKNTGEMCYVGDLKEYEKERAEELISGGYVEKARPKKK